MKRVCAIHNLLDKIYRDLAEQEHPPPQQPPPVLSAFPVDSLKFSLLDIDKNKDSFRLDLPPQSGQLVSKSTSSTERILSKEVEQTVQSYSYIGMFILSFEYHLLPI